MGKNMKSYTTAALAIMLCGLMAGKASAALVTDTYLDTWNTFPGYEAFQGGSDTVGNEPVIEMIKVTYDQGSRLLHSVELALENRTLWDSLFINFNYDLAGGEYYGAWDYMVRDQRGDYGSHQSADAGYLDALARNIGLYEVNYPNDYTYTTTTRTNARTGHPNGIEADDLTALYTNIGGAFITYDENKLIYDFSYLYTQYNDFEVILGEKYMIAYAPWCANDLIGTPVPEPATLLLFGAGLAGLVGIGRRRIRIE